MPRPVTKKSKKVVDPYNDPSRVGGSIQTFTGGIFYPLDPRVEEINLQDVAHGLSHKARFTGHTRKFYCVTPETLILTNQLKWVEAVKLQLDDGLIGFEEEPSGMKTNGNRRRRRVIPSEVRRTEIIKRPVYKFTMSDGSVVRCSSEHSWLTSWKKSRNVRWETAESIAVAVHNGFKRYLPKFFEPWSSREDYKSGYLAGVFDGEGHVTTTQGGVTLGFAQKENECLSTSTLHLSELGLSYKVRGPNKSGVCSVALHGSWAEKIAALGIMQPKRLVAGINRKLLNGTWRTCLHGAKQVQVISAEFEGEQEVVAIETSSKTYFAAGFGAHNCTAEHAVRVSECVARLGGSLMQQFVGLHHDDSDAYIPDVPTPLKVLPEFQFFREVEKKIEHACYERFGCIIDDYSVVKKADMILLLTEKRDLMPRVNQNWGKFDAEPIPSPYRIRPWSPERAKQEYLHQHKMLAMKLSLVLLESL